MTGKEFLDTTKPAVKHFFLGLTDYYSANLPSVFDYVDQEGQIKMGKSEAQLFVQKYEHFLALEEARAILSGSILQVAYSAIRNYSLGGNITEECKYLGVGKSSSISKMCVGRLVHNIPIGLLIYAGRIQYNHWEEFEITNTIAKNVFKQLISVYYNDLTFDMAYEIGYPEPRPLSHYIVWQELNWRTYNDYLSDMISMITE